MTLEEAIPLRHSVRQYTDTPIEADKIARLQDEIARCNQAAGLHIQLVTNEPEAFGGGLAKYGKFSGVRNYLAMVGPQGADEAIGYQGEHIVLVAQTLGLNTCWVGLTFRKQPESYTVGSHEKLHCVIAIGYGANQGVQHALKPMEKFVKATAPLPEWFRQGMQAALLAPTAVNQQKFEFSLLEGNRVQARAKFTMIGYGKMDLGIAKYHFELGAGRERFSWA